MSSDSDNKSPLAELDLDLAFCRPGPKSPRTQIAMPNTPATKNLAAVTAGAAAAALEAADHVVKAVVDLVRKARAADPVEAAVDSAALVPKVSAGRVRAASLVRVEIVAAVAAVVFVGAMIGAADRGAMTGLRFLPFRRSISILFRKKKASNHWRGKSN
jgi:hypothetical protein